MHSHRHSKTLKLCFEQCYTDDVYYFCALVAYLVSEMQTVPQRQVLLDDNRLVCSPLLKRRQLRERLG